LDAVHVSRDHRVEHVYTKTYEEYDRIVKQNVVIVDLWAATANNAVLEAIALNAPFLITRLNSTTQYLGDEYPLFFSDFDELQALLDDEELLRNKLIAANLYLSRMDKSDLTIDRFAEDLRQCAISGAATIGRTSKLLNQEITYFGD